MGDPYLMQVHLPEWKMFGAVFGAILITLSLAATFWWIMTHNRASGAVISGVGATCALTVFAGVALILQDRITELTVRGVGTIRVASAQATADAKTIADLRTRVENQSATVDLVAKQASSAKALSEAVQQQNKRATEKLATLDTAIGEANAALAQIKSEADFLQLVQQAQNDDREAFDKLNKLSEDK